jgi:hypothetical protein
LLIRAYFISLFSFSLILFSAPADYFRFSPFFFILMPPYAFHCRCYFHAFSLSPALPPLLDIITPRARMLLCRQPRRRRWRCAGATPATPLMSLADI